MTLEEWLLWLHLTTFTLYCPRVFSPEVAKGNIMNKKMYWVTPITVELRPAYEESNIGFKLPENQVQSTHSAQSYMSQPMHK